MTDLIERLRATSVSQANSVELGSWDIAKLLDEAADEIEALRADWPLYEHLRSQAAAERALADDLAADLAWYMAANPMLKRGETSMARYRKAREL